MRTLIFTFYRLEKYYLWTETRFIFWTMSVWINIWLKHCPLAAEGVKHAKTSTQASILSNNMQLDPWRRDEQYMNLLIEVKMWCCVILLYVFVLFHLRFSRFVRCVRSFSHRHCLGRPKGGSQPRKRYFWVRVNPVRALWINLQSWSLTDFSCLFHSSSEERTWTVCFNERVL